jgi:hypothetical protein
MLLIQEIHSHIPQAALLQRPEVTQDSDDARQTQGPYGFACTFYGIDKDKFPMPSPKGHFTIPFSSIFESLVSCSEKCAQELEEQKDVVILRGVFSGLLGLLNVMVNRLTTAVNLTWDPSAWLGLMLQSLTYEVRLYLLFGLPSPHLLIQSTIFTTVDRIINLSVSLHKVPYIEPKLNLDDRMVMFKMVNKLLQYLRPDYTAYHVRSVNLIWSLESSVKKPHVESILAQRMTSPESRNVSEAYEAFGVLWRLTGARLPSYPFLQVNSECLLVQRIIYYQVSDSRFL